MTFNLYTDDFEHDYCFAFQAEINQPLGRGLSPFQSGRIRGGFGSGCPNDAPRGVGPFLDCDIGRVSVGWTLQKRISPPARRTKKFSELSYVFPKNFNPAEYICQPGNLASRRRLF
jgi:hypothetical protein